MKRLGCVVFIDAIGFKGIWKKTSDASIVLSRMEEIRSFANYWIQLENQAAGPPLFGMKFELRAFSDTLAFLMYLEDETLPDVAKDDPEGYLKLRKYLLVKKCVLLMSQVIGIALEENKLPFLYRGSIALGDIYENSFAFVGPAVDEAGSYFEQAEGAFVFLCPSAMQALAPKLGSNASEYFPFAVKYEVPLKDGSKIGTYAVNPLLYSGCLRTVDGVFDPVSQRILDFIGEAPQLRSKRQNTEDFLNFTKSNYVPFA